MRDKSHVAVLTGDIVGYSRIEPAAHAQILDGLKHSFLLVKRLTADSQPVNAFEIYRGDSFQGVISDPSLSLEAALIIRTALKKIVLSEESESLDARIAIGIGTVEYLPENVTEGDGQAYRLSGPKLDKMKGNRRLSIVTPDEALNSELDTEMALLDALMNKWTAIQSETVQDLVLGKTRKRIADDYDISQAAVHYRVKGAGWFAVDTLLDRFRRICKKL
ncbi:MAG: hypothetical protein R3211_04360 [Balneolaceae bacterium]|nr:hypothetical protein [Balneolaceae bacterium]